jgi:hypothetical protein
MRQHRALRYGPSALALLAVGLVLMMGRPGDHPVADREARFDPAGSEAGTIFASPLDEPEACESLYHLSADAAALSGSLALVEAGQRPTQAAVVAGRVRHLAAQATGTGGGEELAGALNELADALEQYAAGHPAALASVQDVAARNAQLRQRFRSCMEVTR